MRRTAQHNSARTGSKDKSAITKVTIALFYQYVNQRGARQKRVYYTKKPLTNKIVRNSKQLLVPPRAQQTQPDTTQRIAPPKNYFPVSNKTRSASIIYRHRHRHRCNPTCAEALPPPYCPLPPQLGLRGSYPPPDDEPAAAPGGLPAAAAPPSAGVAEDPPAPEPPAPPAAGSFCSPGLGRPHTFDTGRSLGLPGKEGVKGCG